MQFKHPEILYALFLLLIPIIVHLFQLRKFKKVEFTNVAFLKQATLQTRKSSQIKKWLTLLTRLLLLAAIILAFAQPYTSKLNSFKDSTETIIYLDNSFSMQARGDQGELLKRAVQDILANVDENNNITLLTNDNIFRNTSIKAIRNDLLQLDYAPNSLPLESLFFKIDSEYNKNKSSRKEVVLISDFQDDASEWSFKPDSLTRLNLVKLKPVNTNNIAIDSAYISNTTATNIELVVKLKNSGTPIENLPISLFNDAVLIAKTAVSFDNTAETRFTLPSNTKLNGKISIDDTSLQFDNNLFFNINLNESINVLSITGSDDTFLKRIFTADEFNFTSNELRYLNYNDILNQKLIVLNALDQLPNPLIATLKSYEANGGVLLIIPSEDLNLQSYNALVNAFQINMGNFVTNEKRVTTINFSHPLYDNGVFEKQVSNFQYPKVNSFYDTNSANGSSVLSFEDGKPFLMQSQNLFLFSAPLNNENSNFINSPLIVPTLYNIGRSSLKIPNLYFTIGQFNSFDLPVQLQQDDIISLSNGDLTVIPQQQQFSNKVVVNTTETPNKAGVYAVKNKDADIAHVSFNYDRNESDLTYRNISKMENVVISDSVSDVFENIKSDTKINALWKWFVIFALLLLIVEMLILKYFK